MEDDDVNKLQPPALFGRVTAPAEVGRPPRQRLRARGGSVEALTAGAGLVSGLVLAGLTWAFLRLDSDTHLALIYVLVVFIAAVTAGWLVLRARRAASSGTIAFLGTGIVAVVAMCIGSDPLESLGGAIGVILGCVLAYLLAQWITAHFIDS